MSDVIHTGKGPRIPQPARRMHRSLPLLIILMLCSICLTPSLTRAGVAAAPVDQFAINFEVIAPRHTPEGTTEQLLDALVPGQEALIRTTVKSNATSPQLVGLSFEEPVVKNRGQSLPPGARSSLRDLEIILFAPGETRTFEQPVVWSGDTIADPLAGDVAAPSAQVLVSGLTACLIQEGAQACPDPQEQPEVAAYHEIQIPIRPNDLGDAPDSTNHFAGVPMSAYPGIPANFPTVFDPATGAPSGPLHRHPRPFHLGKRVSLEAEADSGPDQDPFNNILPPANDPDNDRADDGIQPGQLNFVHCQPATFQASVFIDAALKAALLQNGINQAHLNVWVDGTRNGDWNDVVPCPQVAGQPPVAVEHIVIDQPVNIAALVPGTTIIPVATGRVPWPAALQERPAWLRVTLSLEPSTKTRGAAGVVFGDGRSNQNTQGNPIPFRTGETEDYLINRGPDGGADLDIRKAGRLQPINPENPFERHIVWALEYHNSGDTVARDAVLRDRFDGDQTIIGVLIGVRSEPEVSHVPEGDALRFNLGDIAPGEGGRILITTKIPTLSEQEKVRNLADIQAANDTNPTNNRAYADVVVKLPAPIIVTPSDGTTCSRKVTFAGLAVPGSTVAIVTMHDVMISSVVANAQGRWQTEAELNVGRNVVFAVARLDGRTTQRSAPVGILVDPTLPYDPLSLRLQAEDSLRRIRPVDAQGRTDDGGWRVHLQANTTYTVTVKSCCDEPNARLRIVIPDRPDIELLDPDGDKIYTGRFTTGDGSEPTNFALVVNCGNVVHAARGIYKVHGASRVLDRETGQPIEGARVILLRCRSHALCLPALNVDDNPQTTGENGVYSFDPASGFYALHVSKPGYYPFRSRIRPIFDDPFFFDVYLQPIPTTAADQSVAVNAFTGAFEVGVLGVRAGTTIEFRNLDVWEHGITISPNPAGGATALQPNALEQEEGIWMGVGESFKVRFPSTTTPVTYTITDSTNAFNTMTVVVEPQAQTGTFRVFLPQVRR